MTDGTLWITMLAAGLLTFLIRYSFIGLPNRLGGASRRFEYALPLVPIAALTALITPDILILNDQVAWTHNPKLLAALIAILVAWRWKNTTLTIASGFVALYLLR